MGFSSYRYSRLYNVVIPESRLIWQRDQVHTVENQLAPLKWLGVPLPEAADLELFVADESRQRLRARLRAHGLLRNGFILIHPTATLFTKQWDPDKFGHLIERLVGQYQAQVVVSVGPEERQVAQAIKASTTRPFVIFDDLSVSDLMALIDEASLFIGCDSGPTHMAAALKKDIVVIFGSSNAIAWRPWNARSELLQSDLPCIPCPGYRCYEFSEPKCIKQISVEAVLDAVNRILVKDER
jgi:ADP-heptose:LPS heptosyltransferase